MFSFLKPKQSGDDIAIEHYRLLQRNRAAGFPESNHLFPQEAQIDSGAVKDEWLYFQIFLFDFALYQAFGATAAKAAVLTPFWTHIKGWLQNEQVSALPIRLAVAGGGPLTIPAEPAESSYARLSRRVQQYASAVSSPESQGVNYSVAAVFANASGDMNALSILEVSVYFSSLTAQLVKLFQKLRIGD